MLHPRISKPDLAPEPHCSFQRWIDYSSPQERVHADRTPAYSSIVQCHDDRCSRHDPHSAHPDSRSRSSRQRQRRDAAGEGQRLCLSCHGPTAIGPFADSILAHTHHKSDSAGNQCVACHMPLIEETLKDVKSARAYVPLHHPPRRHRRQRSAPVHTLPHGQDLSGPNKT